jgi:hypothetical protein
MRYSAASFSVFLFLSAAASARAVRCRGRCAEEEPQMHAIRADQFVACHFTSGDLIA